MTANYGSLTLDYGVPQVRNELLITFAHSPYLPTVGTSFALYRWQQPKKNDRHENKNHRWTNRTANPVLGTRTV